jgi:benzoyl-CoA reductase/2-hydroxyglutaryl-CoA dehydratase subunit BcrC/BadD/HgdB
MVNKKKEEYLFERRYSAKFSFDRLEHSRKEAKDKYDEITKDNISRIRSSKSRAASMNYFDELFLQPEKRIEELKRFKEGGGKIIGTFCVMVPEEIIYAAGMIPIRLCMGFYETIYAGEEVLPKNICPVVKSIMGFASLKINPYFELCDAFVVPTTCDAKKKLAEVFSEFSPVFTLDVPHNKDAKDSESFWFSQVQRFKENIERFGNKKISKQQIKDSIEVLHKRTEVYRRLLAIKREKIPVISGRDSLLVAHAVNYASVDDWIRNVEILCDEIEKEKKPIGKEDTTRIMLTGSPIFWPNWKILHIIEEMDAVIVIDDLCSGTQSLYNPCECDHYSEKAMMQAIADKYLSPCICPCFIHSDDRLDRIFELKDQYAADGIIYHIIRLCQLFDIEFIRAEKIMNAKGIPLLKIESEFSLEDVGQIKTRVEAFLEILRTRKEMKIK